MWRIFRIFRRKHKHEDEGHPEPDPDERVALWGIEVRGLYSEPMVFLTEDVDAAKRGYRRANKEWEGTIRGVRLLLRESDPQPTKLYDAETGLPIHPVSMEWDPDNIDVEDLTEEGLRILSQNAEPL